MCTTELCNKVHRKVETKQAREFKKSSKEQGKNYARKVKKKLVNNVNQKVERT